MAFSTDCCSASSAALAWLTSSGGKSWKPFEEPLPDSASFFLFDSFPCLDCCSTLALLYGNRTGLDRARDRRGALRAAPGWRHPKPAIRNTKTGRFYNTRKAWEKRPQATPDRSPALPTTFHDRGLFVSRRTALEPLLAANVARWAPPRSH